MQKLFFILIFLCLPIVLSAQKIAGITGNINNSDSGEGMGYVTIVAADQKGKQVASAISKNTGEFLLPLPKGGDYTIHITFMGHKTVSKAVTYNGSTFDIGKITLEKASVELGEVKVRPLIRREADRIVYNVGDDPDAARMKMMEIMKKIPELGMNPGSGNLNYDNSPIAQILFDGKNEDIINSSRQYPMEFIRANYMDQIELILPGSSEYNNDKPIINIKLARPLPNGIAGQISPVVNSTRQYDTEVDMITKTNMFGVGLNYRFGYSHPIKLKTEMQRYNLQDDSQYYLIENKSESWRISNSHNVGINLFRPIINENIKLRISANTSLSEGNSYTNSSSDMMDKNNAIINSSTTSSHNRSLSPMRINGGVSFDHTLGVDKRSGYKITYSYSENSNDIVSHNNNTSTTSNNSKHKSDGNTGTKQHVTNISSIYRPVHRKKSYFLYAYLNYINRLYTNTTDYYYYDYSLGDYVVDQDRYNGLTYRQEYASARLAFNNAMLNKKLRYTIDLNFDNLSNKGTFLSTNNTKLDYNEFNVLPSLRFNYNLKGFFINAGYKTWVKRPDVNQLNPYIDDSNPINIFVGNPRLRGEYGHQLFASFMKPIKSKIITNLSLSYGVHFTNNAITQITKIDRDNISVTSFDNLGHTRRHNIFLSFSPDLHLNFLKMTVNTGYSMDEYSDRNTVTSFSGSASMSVYAKKSPILRINYGISPAFSSAQNKGNTYVSSLNMSVDKYFAKLHMGGSISVNDLLHSNRSYRETIGSDQFIQYAQRQRQGRSVRVSLYWRFGRFKDSDKIEGVQGEVYDMSTPDMSSK